MRHLALIFVAGGGGGGEEVELGWVIRIHTTIGKYKEKIEVYTLIKWQAFNLHLKRF